MKDFHNYLLSKMLISNKKVPYYVSWVKKYFAFTGSGPENQINSTLIDKFISNLTNNHEDWQIIQAKELLKFINILVKNQRMVHTSKVTISRNNGVSPLKPW